MARSGSILQRLANRRSFLKKGVLAAGAATLGAGLLGTRQSAYAQRGDLTQGEAYLPALKSFSGFRGSDGRAWLLAIVRNSCYTALAKSGTASLRLLSTKRFTLPMPAP